MKCVLAIVLLLAFPARAADDAPLRTALPDGSQIWNKPAVDAVDAEMRRLQIKDMEHEREKAQLVRNGVTFTLIGLGVGVTAGVVGGVLLGVALAKR